MRVPLTVARPATVFSPTWRNRPNSSPPVAFGIFLRLRADSPTPAAAALASGQQHTTRRRHADSARSSWPSPARSSVYSAVHVSGSYQANSRRKRDLVAKTYAAAPAPPASRSHPSGFRTEDTRAASGDVVRGCDADSWSAHRLTCCGGRALGSSLESAPMPGCV